MVQEGSPQHASLRVKSDIYALKDVQQWFRQFSQIPNRTWQQCNLVLTEGFTNAVYHAHSHLPEETPIDIEATCDERMLELRIWDWGAPFDLKGKVRSIIAQTPAAYDVDNIDELATGGRGLIIADAIADYLSYDRTADGRNCFVFRKFFAPDTGNRPKT